MATKTDARLFLLDGMALIYRAHFALIRSPIYTSSGFNSSAVFGFATRCSISKPSRTRPTWPWSSIRRPRPFDTRNSPSTRRSDKKCPRLECRHSPCETLAEAFNVPVITLDGYEADDIIGTLARRADEDGHFQTFMVTPDKDFAQLVSDSTSIYKPGRQGSDHEILGLPEILEKWEIERPAQIIDILGLWGDASDNIPGIPGIGEKTSKKLVKRFGSIEACWRTRTNSRVNRRKTLSPSASRASSPNAWPRSTPTYPSRPRWKAWPCKTTTRKAAGLLIEFEFNTLGQRLFGKDFKIGRSARLRAQGIDPDALETIADVEKH